MPLPRSSPLRRSRAGGRPVSWEVEAPDPSLPGATTPPRALPAAGAPAPLAVLWGCSRRGGAVRARAGPPSWRAPAAKLKVRPQRNAPRPRRTARAQERALARALARVRVRARAQARARAQSRVCCNTCNACSASVAFATFRGAAAVGDRLLHAKLPNFARTGALAKVSAELEKLGAKIEAVEKEISDTEVELRTAKENNNQGEVRRLHDEKKQLREKEKQLRDEKNLLLERALPAPGALWQATSPPPGNVRSALALSPPSRVHT